MKKTLFTLALLAFAGSTAFAHEGDEKAGKKGKKKAAAKTEAKAHCNMDMSAAAKPSCCMKKDGKTAESTMKTPAASVAKEL